MQDREARKNAGPAQNLNSLLNTKPTFTNQDYKNTLVSSKTCIFQGLFPRKSEFRRSVIKQVFLGDSFNQGSLINGASYNRMKERWKCEMPKCEKQNFKTFIETFRRVSL